MHNSFVRVSKYQSSYFLFPTYNIKILYNIVFFT